jgi:hypothetical protein
VLYTDLNDAQWQKNWDEIKPSLLELDREQNKKVIEQAKNIQQQLVTVNEEKLRIQ